MKYRAVLVAIALLVPASASATSPARIEVRIAKTQAAVIGLGKVNGTTADPRVVARLYKYKESGPGTLLARTRVPLRDDNTFRAKFDRPERGTCFVLARLVDEPHGWHGPPTFPCYIPDFGEGRASLISVTATTEIDVLLASTSEQRAYGLMYRPRLRSDLGMAFLFEGDSSGGFWMKNTLIPLSIAFIDANGFIVRIMDMDPCTEDPCPSYNPDATYRTALEVNQGAFEEWGIHEGDRVEISE